MPDEAQLIKILPEPLKGPPSLERILAFLKSSAFRQLKLSLDYLKEYELELELVEKLLRFVESCDRFSIDDPEHRNGLLQLHRWKLNLLDRADKWEDYLKNIEALRQRPELMESRNSITEGAYIQLKQLISQSARYPKSYKAHLEEQITEIETQGHRTHDQHGTTVIKLPQRHLVDNSVVRLRVRVIRKKLARRDAGKRVDYLQHKQTWELSDQEYQRRIEWLEKWREFCRQVDESIKRAAGR